MLHFKLIIFDCDGVLVDSEHISQEVLSNVLGRLGIELSPEEVGVQFMSRTLPQCIELAESMMGRKMTDATIAEWRDELYETFRTRPVLAVEGIHELLDQLQTPVCVVSNGPFDKMRATLGATDLLQHFEGKLFSPELGIAGKPAPDLFLAAASANHVKPEECAVIEDSPGGIRGAIAAGMQAFGFTGLPHTKPDALKAAGATLVNSMQELKSQLEE